jgi:predicted branched-subunit amino acid permease
MERPRITTGHVARVAVELLLATLSLWLVVQNLLLIATHPWKSTPQALVAAQALLKVGAALTVALGPWMALAGLVAGVGAIWLLREHPSRPAGEARNG